MEKEYTLERGYVTYPDACGDDPSAKAPYKAVPLGLVSKERYITKDEANLEWQRMWTKTWLWAGMTHDLKNVGDYFRYNLGPETFIVVRSGEDKVQAFYNVCPHRANHLVYEDYGHIKEGASIYCKYHGWRFNLDGSIRTIKDIHTFPPENLCGMNGLTEVRCEIWNSLVFINMDAHAEPLETYLDVIPRHLANRDFSRLRVIEEMEGVIDANWKTAIEAFIEFYHADDTHPQIIPFSATLRTQYDLYDHGMSRMIIPLGYSGDRAQDPDEVSEALQGFIGLYGGNADDYKDIKGGDYRVAFADTLRKWAKRNGHSDLFDRMTDGELTDDWNYHLFPNVTLNVFSHSLLIQSWTPHESDPEKHVYRALGLHLPLEDPEGFVVAPASFGVPAEKGWNGADRPAKVNPVNLADWGTVLSQDMERVPLIHKGLRSRSFEGSRLSMSECRIAHYLAEIDHYIGDRESGGGEPLPG